MSRWAPLLMSGAFVMSALSARADIVMGEPPRCPEGTRPAHARGHLHRCVPWTCEGERDCPATLACRAVCECVTHALTAGSAHDLVGLDTASHGYCDAAGECEHGAPAVRRLCVGPDVPESPRALPDLPRPELDPTAYLPPPAAPPPASSPSPRGCATISTSADQVSLVMPWLAAAVCLARRRRRTL